MTAWVSELRGGVRERVVVQIFIVECQGPNESRFRAELREAVKHQDALTAPVGPHFKSRTMRGKWVWPNGPLACGVDRWLVAFMIAVIHDQFEEPLRAGEFGLETRDVLPYLMRFRYRCAERLRGVRLFS